CLPRPRRPPGLSLFPYTTLFRSALELGQVAPLGPGARQGEVDVPSHRRPRDRPVEDGVLDAGLDRVGREPPAQRLERPEALGEADRKSTRLNSSHVSISYAVFCL